MAELSPAAQAVLDAAVGHPVFATHRRIAAALRAAADQVVPEEPPHPLANSAEAQKCGTPEEWMYEGITNWKELCTELVAAWDSYSYADPGDATDRMTEAVNEAEAALAQPEPEGLTDEEMWDLYYYELERDPIRLARAVLARCCGCFAKQ